MTLVNAFNVRSGVRCPNCREELYSEETYKEITCKCSYTSLSGGTEFLAIKVQAPFVLSDIQVVSKSMEEEYEYEEEEEGGEEWIEVEDSPEDEDEQEVPENPTGTLD